MANVLKRHGLLPAPDREKRTTWRELIRTHAEVLAAVDFFSAEVWTSVGLITYYVLVFRACPKRLTPLCLLQTSVKPAKLVEKMWKFNSLKRSEKRGRIEDRLEEFLAGSSAEV